MDTITATKEQLKALKDSLKRGTFNVDIFPEISAMFQRKGFIEIIADNYREADEADKDTRVKEIELSRDLNVCILEALQSGVFPLYKVRPTLEQMSRPLGFIEALIMCSGD